MAWTCNKCNGLQGDSEKCLCGDAQSSSSSTGYTVTPSVKDIYTMTVAELEKEKEWHENCIREIKRLKTPPNQECHG